MRRVLILIAFAGLLGCGGPEFTAAPAAADPSGDAACCEATAAPQADGAAGPPQGDDEDQSEAGLPESGPEASPPAEAGLDASLNADAAGDSGGNDACSACVDSGSDATDASEETIDGSAPDSGDIADASTDAVADASDSGTFDAGTDAGTTLDASEAGTIGPTCDGVIQPGEYGNNVKPDSFGNDWYVTWDDTNMYVAIVAQPGDAGAAVVGNGNVLYVASNPGGGGTGLTTGQPYDNTDITTLPFAADLVVYAKDSYNDAQVVSNGAWGSPSASAIQVCTNGTTNTREEVIPWSLLGGRPSSFGWFGYVAANPNNNPQGYIYGQMPTDNPGASPANNLTYTKYFDIPDATPGKDPPFWEP